MQPTQKPWQAELVDYKKKLGTDGYTTIQVPMEFMDYILALVEAKTLERAVGVARTIDNPFDGGNYPECGLGYVRAQNNIAKAIESLGNKK